MAMYPCACSAGCCSGLTVQEPFQCNGTIDKITCQISSNQKIRVYVIPEGENGVNYRLATLQNSKRSEDVNTKYQAGDTIAFHISQDVDSAE